MSTVIYTLHNGSINVYTIEYYSAIKKEWYNVISHNTDGPRDCQTKWSKSDRERQIYWSTTHLS